jgi:hypothetical protein
MGWGRRAGDRRRYRRDYQCHVSATGKRRPKGSCIVRRRRQAYVMAMQPRGTAMPDATMPGATVPNATMSDTTIAAPTPGYSRPLVVVIAAVAVLLVGTVALWAHYGTAVFYETILAGIAACI